MNKGYTITLPRGIEVDIFNLPKDFDEIVLKCFAEYTNGTSKDYRDVDRLGFMDCFVRHLNNDMDNDDLVDNRVKEMFEDNWSEGNLLDEEEIYCREFMYDCCDMGMNSAMLSSHYGLKDHHIYDEIHKVVARVMKIVSNATEEQIKEKQNE